MTLTCLFCKMKSFFWDAYKDLSIGACVNCGGKQFHIVRQHELYGKRINEIVESFQ